MPRPANGYRNAAGQPIPGTTDIIGRFKNYSRLMGWAFSRGKAGAAQLYEKGVLDIGTAVHTMAELDLRGDPASSIEFYLTASLRDPEHIEKARTAFASFKKWRSEFAVEPYKQEISLISEKLQFGGTPDLIATIRNGRGLLDIKSAGKREVFEDHVLQLAGYGILWLENFPDEPLDEGYHLLLLPKDGSPPIHREWTHEQLHRVRQKFWLYRKAYDLDAPCNDSMFLNGTAIKPSRPKPTKPAPKAPAAPASMGEMLRAYGLIREEARA